MDNKFPLKTISVLLFLTLAAGAFVLARHKPLWNDEIYSQVNIVEGTPVGAVLAGHFEEGNNCPLFYLLQKGITGLLNYQAPREWGLGNLHWTGGGTRDRIVLRVQPVLFMSAVPVICFYFLSRCFSVWTGLFSLVLTLSTSMFWRYWAEARPYGLWVFLTALQVCLLLCLLREEKKRGMWAGLLAVHAGLALTVVFSAAQIALVSGVLFFFGPRERRGWVWVLAAPAVFSVYYLTQAPHFKFWLEFSLEQYIRANIPRDRMHLSIVYAVYFLPFLVQLWKPKFKLYRDRTMLEGLPFMLLLIGSCAAVAAVVQVFSWRASPRGTGFPVTERYFVNLIPVGVVCVSVFVRTLLVSFKDKVWMQGVILAGTSVLVVRAVIKVVPDIAGHYPLLFK